MVRAVFFITVPIFHCSAPEAAEKLLVLVGELAPFLQMFLKRLTSSQTVVTKAQQKETQNRRTAHANTFKLGNARAHGMHLCRSDEVVKERQPELVFSVLNLATC